MRKWITSLCSALLLAAYLTGCPLANMDPDPSTASLETVANALLTNLSALDINEDGFLSLTEAQVGHADMSQAYLDEMDTDNDGLLSEAEIQAIVNTTCGECLTETFMLPGDVPLTMIGIANGTFMMGSIDGSPDETPVHEVTITDRFQLGETEVTKAQWEAVMGTAPWSEQNAIIESPDSPAVYISWNDVQVFITTLNNLTGLSFHLPTEAQWEYACRAGSTTQYSFGDGATDLSEYAWWQSNGDSAGEQYAHIVGQFPSNNFALFDMHGNVSEWCADWYGSQYYQNSPTDEPDENPTGPTSASDRVTRGGNWGSSASECRSADRDHLSPNFISARVGFRLAR